MGEVENKRVIAGAALEHITAPAARQGVVAPTAIQPVAAGAAVQPVGKVVAGERVTVARTLDMLDALEGIALRRRRPRPHRRQG